MLTSNFQNIPNIISNAQSDESQNIHHTPRVRGSLLRIGGQAGRQGLRVRTATMVSLFHSLPSLLHMHSAVDI